MWLLESNIKMALLISMPLPNMAKKLLGQKLSGISVAIMATIRLLSHGMQLRHTARRKMTSLLHLKLDQQRQKRRQEIPHFYK